MLLKKEAPGCDTLMPLRISTLPSNTFDFQKPYICFLNVLISFVCVYLILNVVSWGVIFINNKIQPVLQMKTCLLDKSLPLLFFFRKTPFWKYSHVIEIFSILEKLSWSNHMSFFRYDQMKLEKLKKSYEMLRNHKVIK